MYNPLKFQYKDYSDDEAGLAQFELDSTRAYSRRNQVLFQWLVNSDAGNEALSVTLNRAQYDSLCALPIAVDYQIVDHKEGLAPHFRKKIVFQLQFKKKIKQKINWKRK